MKQGAIRPSNPRGGVDELQAALSPYVVLPNASIEHARSCSRRLPVRSFSRRRNPSSSALSSNVARTSASIPLQSISRDRRSARSDLTLRNAFWREDAGVIGKFHDNRWNCAISICAGNPPHRRAVRPERVASPSCQTHSFPPLSSFAGESTP